MKKQQKVKRVKGYVLVDSKDNLLTDEFGDTRFSMNKEKFPHVWEHLGYKVLPAVITFNK